MCTVLAGVKPSHVARLRQANVMRCKGPRVCAGDGSELAARQQVIGPTRGKRDRWGGQPTRRDHKSGRDDRGVLRPQGLRLELEGVQPAIPTQIAFLGGVPNPSRGAPIMRFALPTAMTVTLELFDVQGRKSAVVASGKLFAPGVHALKVTGERLASGVYFARFKAGSFEQTRRVIVLGKQ